MKSNQKELKAGDVLFREGERGDEMYVISSGKIRISKRAEGEEVELAELGTGEFLGEMAILNNEKRNATATAIEDSTLMIYDRNTFENMLYKNPHIAIRMVFKLADRLRKTDELVPPRSAERATAPRRGSRRAGREGSADGDPD